MYRLFKQNKILSTTHEVHISTNTTLNSKLYNTWMFIFIPKCSLSLSSFSRLLTNKVVLRFRKVFAAFKHPIYLDVNPLSIMTETGNPVEEITIITDVWVDVLGSGCFAREH